MDNELENGWKDGQSSQPEQNAGTYQPQGSYDAGAYQQQQGSYNAGTYQHPQGGYDAGAYQQPQGSYNAGAYQQQGGYNAGAYQQQAGTLEPQQKEKGSTAALVSMILGICAIVLDCCCTYLGIILGIVAIVLAVIDKKNNDGVMDGKAKAGMICGIVAIALSVLSIILVIAGIVDTSWLTDLING